jgi:hypothetical protein
MHIAAIEESRRLDSSEGSGCHRAPWCVLQAGHDVGCSPTFRTAELHAQERIMLRIEWTDRGAAADDCTISLAEFLTVNDLEGLGAEHTAAVLALKVGESALLDWTTVTRVADGSPRVGAVP